MNILKNVFIDCILFGLCAGHVLVESDNLNTCSQVLNSKMPISCVDVFNFFFVFCIFCFFFSPIIKSAVVISGKFVYVFCRVL